MATKIGIGPLRPLRKFSKKFLSPKTEENQIEKDAEKRTAEMISNSLGIQEEGQLSVDVTQTDEEIIIIAPIAGVMAEDLNVSITDDVISIRGRRINPLEATDNQYYTHECFWGEFSRSIVLPEAVDSSKIKATFKNGILKISVPKIEQIRTRTIKVIS